jgi:Beta-propeller repeat
VSAAVALPLVLVGFGAAPVLAASVAPSSLIYSTYFGGSGKDEGFMVAAAPAGGVYATGFLGHSGGSVTSYVVDYDATAKIVWNTTIAGAGDVTAYYIRANSTAVYIVGVTKAHNLPAATNSFPVGSSTTAFMTVLNPASGSIVRSIYLGGAGFSAANVDAIDPATGNVYVGMSTGSQTRLLKLDPTGIHVLWSRLLGGSGGTTHPYGMQADASGNVVVATLTNSTSYPVLHAQQQVYDGGYDTGVTSFTPQGQMVWSTYLGGTAQDRPNGLDIDPSGNVYVAGRTYSSNFPLKNAVQQANQDLNAAFVTSYTSAGAMRYSTYIGGNRAEWFGGVTVAADGTAWAVGGSSSTNLPAIGGAGYVAKKGQYAYVAAVQPGGGALSYSSYLGGSANDGASGAVIVSGGIWLIGQTTSRDFPTKLPTQATNAGGFDAWVAFLATS